MLIDCIRGAEPNHKPELIGTRYIDRNSQNKFGYFKHLICSDWNFKKLLDVSAPPPPLYNIGLKPICGLKRDI